MTTTVILIGSLIIIILIIVFFMVSDHMFYSLFQRRAEQIRNEAGSFDKTPVNEKDLGYLPLPVLKYLKLSGLIGKPLMSSGYIRHSGLLRIAAGREFSRVKGEYYVTVKDPSFCWFGKVRVMGIPVAAFDSYFKGSGRMVVKLLSFFKLADARSVETGFSAFGRCIAEMSMAPSFFMDKERITWTSSDSRQAFCTISDSGINISTEMYFNPEGYLDRIVIQRYFDRGNGRFTVEKFTGAASAYREFGGVKIPSVLDGYWNLEDGDLHYVHFIIEEARYEV